MYTIYQIQNGDNLLSVASKFGMQVDELANLNGLMMDEVLNPGEYIVVPKLDNENLYFKKYTIKKGDTIYGIAREKGVDKNYLLRLNGLNENDTIYEGETIFVPRDDVSFYITGMDDTLNDVIKNLNASADEIVSQNNVIYLTNDQLIVYKK